MSEHDSHDDAQISALYRRMAHEEPPAHLDERVRVTAGRHARRSHRWWLPLSTAAVVVLAVSLLLRHQQAPDEVQQQIAQLEPAPAASVPASAPVPVPVAPSPAVPRKEERIAAKPEPGAKSSVAEAPVAEASSAESDKSVAPPAEVAAAPAPALAVAPTTDMAETKQAAVARSAAAPQTAAGVGVLQKREAAAEAPEPWLKRIDTLRIKGETEAAKRELAAFRKVYPNWPIPKELQPLLPEPVK